MPALINTLQRILESEKYVPVPDAKYHADIVLGFDSAGGFPQIQGQDTRITTNHMTPGTSLSAFMNRN